MPFTLVKNGSRAKFVDSATGKTAIGLHTLILRKWAPAGSTYGSLKHRVYKKKSKADQKLKLRYGKTKKPPKGRGIGLMVKGVADNRTAKGMGNFIDGQAKRYVEAANGDPEVLRIWTHSGDQPILTMRKGGVKLPPKPRLNLHPYVNMEIQTLLKHGLHPKACQVVIGSSKRGVATALDYQCEVAAGKLHAVVEAKAGYEVTWDAHTNSYLEKPLNELRDSPHNKALLQAYLGALLLQDHLKLSYTPKAYVLHVNRSGAKLEEVPEAITKHRAEIVKMLTAW